MKKLKLTALSLGAREVLSRDQLRSIYGGSGSETGSDTGSGSGSSCSYASCCVDCKGGAVNIDCGFGVTCTVVGTTAKCGNEAFKERCNPV